MQTKIISSNEKLTLKSPNGVYAIEHVNGDLYVFIDGLNRIRKPFLCHPNHRLLAIDNNGHLKSFMISTNEIVIIKNIAFG
jgi:hypothetical protein